MRGDKLIESNIQFIANKKEYNFTVVHNLEGGIEPALESWLFRTKRFVAENLCKYVMSKHCDVVCMTKEQFDRLNHD